MLTAPGNDSRSRHAVCAWHKPPPERPAACPPPPFLTTPPPRTHSLSHTHAHTHTQSTLPAKASAPRLTAASARSAAADRLPPAGAGTRVKGASDRAQGRGGADWDWEAYVDQVIAEHVGGGEKGHGAAVRFRCDSGELMDVRAAEAYADRVLVSPSASTGLMEGDQMLRLQQDAHKLNAILSQMASQEEGNASLIDSARKSIRSSLGRVSEGWVQDQSDMEGEEDEEEEKEEEDTESWGLSADAADHHRASTECAGEDAACATEGEWVRGCSTAAEQARRVGKREEW